MILPPYRSDLPFSYAFGRFAAHEALERRPADVRLVLWHSELPTDQLQQLQAAAAAAGAPIRRDDATVTRLRRKATVRCLAQVMKRDEKLQPHAAHVALVGASHPGNVGTAIRSMAAFGFTDLALIRSGIDPWGAYVIRASVGLRFAVACQEFESPREYAAAFPRHSLLLFDPHGEAELDDVEFTSPFTLLFGPEWRDRRAQDHDDEFSALDAPPLTVRIPQDNRVESLNLAISVSVATYRARRQ